MTTTNPDSRFGRWMYLALVGIIGAAAARVLGERAWWVVPPLIFALSIGALLIGRRRLTITFALFAAGLAIAVGAVLKLT